MNMSESLAYQQNHHNTGTQPDPNTPLETDLTIVRGIRALQTMKLRY